MALEPISVNNLTQVGRTNMRDPNVPDVYVTYDADFASAASYAIDFTLINQQQQFGVVRGLFCDNGTNPEPVEVSVTITNQFFTVPAFAQGYFKIDASINSSIIFESVGGATDKVTITLYNYEIAPNVWYSFGPTNIPNPLPVSVADGADVAEGAVADAPYTGSGNGTVISLLKGLWASFFDVASGATDSGNPVKVGGRYNSPAPTINPGQRGDLQIGARGSLNVSIYGANTTLTPLVNANGSNGLNVSVNSLYTASFLYNFNGATFDRVSKPNTTARLLSSAASTNATSVKATTGDLFKIVGRNTSATPIYLKLYNKASAPTVGTDTPIQTYFLPAGASFDIVFDTPYYFSLGIGYALTLNAPDADTTAIVAGDIVCMNVVYQ